MYKYTKGVSMDKLMRAIVKYNCGSITADEVYEIVDALEKKYPGLSIVVSYDGTGDKFKGMTMNWEY